ncbi:hypothetical protein [Nocardioides alkalitolerans]|uniref:hypothetical protein n=1 Tax=Nocardioides alkalitolerans TaxID=281714 RepID=UPI0004145A19|nr:hypothetical protein [Nocardioides alkalitolerans]
MTATIPSTVRRAGLRVAAALLLGAALVACTPGADDQVVVTEVAGYELDGAVSAVRLPPGELEVVVTAPYDEQPTDEVVGNGPYVGIRWSLERDYVQADPYATAAGEIAPFDVELDVDGRTYDLEAGTSTEFDPLVDEPDPVVTAKAVVVSVPDAFDVYDDLRLRITYDGVTQVLDPRTGDVRTGDAGALYDGSTTTWRTPACDAIGLEPPAAFVDGDGLSCVVGAVTAVPWTAETGWAAAGEVWWVVGVSTQLVDDRIGSSGGPPGGPGEAGVWTAGAIASASLSLDGEQPAAERPGTQEDAYWGTTVVLAAPDQRPATATDAMLRLQQTYAVAAAGEDSPPAPAELVVDVDLPIGPLVPLADEVAP